MKDAIFATLRYNFLRILTISILTVITALFITTPFFREIKDVLMAILVAITSGMIVTGKVAGKLNVEFLGQRRFEESVRIYLHVSNKTNVTIRNVIPLLDFNVEELKHDSKYGIFVFYCDEKSAIMECINGRKIKEIDIEKGDPAFYKLATPEQYRRLSGVYLNWAVPDSSARPLKHIALMPPYATNEINVMDIYVARINGDRYYLLLRIFSEYGTDQNPRITYAIKFEEQVSVSLKFSVQITGEPAIKFKKEYEFGINAKINGIEQKKNEKKVVFEVIICTKECTQKHKIFEKVFREHHVPPLVMP